MKKWLLLMVGAVVVLVVGVTLCAQIVVNRSFVREKIRTILSEQLGREVTLGRLGARIVPSLRVSIQDFAIKEADKKSDFVSVKQVVVGVKLLPLLTGNVVVSKVIVDAPSITVTQNQDGQFNFQDLGAPGKEPQVAPEEETVASTSVKGTSLPSMRVDLIKVRNGTFTFNRMVSAGEPLTVVIEDLDVTIKRFSFTDPISIRLATKIGDASVSFKGSIGPLGEIDIETLPLALDLAVKQLSMEQCKPFLDEPMQSKFYFSDLNCDAKIKGTLKEGIKSTITLTTASLEKANKVHIDGAIDLTVQGSLSDLGKLSITGSTDIRELGVLLEGIDDPLVLSGAKVVYSKDIATIEGITVKVGQTDMSATGEVSWKEGIPGADLSITSDKIVVDQFVPFPEIGAPSPKDEEPAEKKEAEAAPSQAIEIPAIVKQATLKLKVQCKEIHYGPNVLNNALLDVELDQGVLKIKDLSSKLFGGTIKAKGTADLNDPLIASKFEASLDQVDINEIVSRNLNMKDKLLGRLIAKVALETKGTAQQDIIKHLVGNGKLELKDAQYKGGDIRLAILRCLDTPLLANLLPKIKEARNKREEEMKGKIVKNEVSEARAVFSVKDEVAQVSEVFVSAKDFGLTAQGTVALSDGYKVNAPAQLNLSKEFTELITGGKDISDVLPYRNEGVLIPVVITYPPMLVLPDVKELVQEQAKGRIFKALDKAMGKDKKKEEGSAVPKEDKKSKSPAGMVGSFFGGLLGSEDKGKEEPATEPSIPAEPLEATLADESSEEPLKGEAVPKKSKGLFGGLLGGDDQATTEGEGKKKKVFGLF